MATHEFSHSIFDQKSDQFICRPMRTTATAQNMCVGEREGGRECACLLPNGAAVRCIELASHLYTTKMLKYSHFTMVRYHSFDFDETTFCCRRHLRRRRRSLSPLVSAQQNAAFSAYIILNRYKKLRTHTHTNAPMRDYKREILFAKPKHCCQTMFVCVCVGAQV